jgi:flavin-dependent dehydrogenase
MWDVVIVGAGPAGSVAAHVLAREGRTVLLVDPLAEQTAKVGETLPGAALRMLRTLRLPTPDQSGHHTPIGGTLSCWGSDELMATDFFRDPDGPGWRLDRLCFDASLRETAIASGAVFKRTRLTEIQSNRGRWRITLANREAIEATWVIDATGRSASVARRLGARRVRDNALIAVYAIGDPRKRISTNRTVIEATRNGWWYAGLLPSGAAIAGFHFLPQSTPFRLRSESWNCELEQTHYIKTIFRDVVFALPLIARDASGGRLSSPNGDAWLACGDAAACFDPVSGQGIFSAIYGGMSAGIAIHKSLSGDGTALGEYKLRLEAVRRIYQSSCKSMYESQNRWPDTDFWLQMRQH